MTSFVSHCFPHVFKSPMFSSCIPHVFKSLSWKERLLNEYILIQKSFFSFSFLYLQFSIHLLLSFFILLLYIQVWEFPSSAFWTYCYQMETIIPSLSSHPVYAPQKTSTSSAYPFHWTLLPQLECACSLSLDGLCTVSDKSLHYLDSLTFSLLSFSSCFALQMSSSYNNEMILSKVFHDKLLHWGQEKQVLPLTWKLKFEASYAHMIILSVHFWYWKFSVSFVFKYICLFLNCVANMIYASKS